MIYLVITKSDPGRILLDLLLRSEALSGAWSVLGASHTGVCWGNALGENFLPEATKCLKRAAGFLEDPGCPPERSDYTAGSGQWYRGKLNPSTRYRCRWNSGTWISCQQQGGGGRGTGE